MKKTLLLILASLMTVVSASALNFEIVNADGITIYYMTSGSNTVEVTAKDANVANSYSGDVVLKILGE